VKRPHCTGTVDALRSGRFRARLRTAAGRRTVGIFGTREEAERELDVQLQALVERGAHPSSGVTVGGLYRIVIVRRRAEGYRAVDDDESRWKTHLADTVGALPAADVTAGDVRALLANMAKAGKAAQTRRNVLQLLRGVLAHGVDTGAVERNVAVGIKVRDQGRTKERSTWLTEPEAERLVDATLRAYPEIALAIATGLRAGEQAALRWEDVHEGHLTIRFGSPNKPTKNGKIRKVPILPLAREALRWARALSNGSPWVHPGLDGPRSHVQPRKPWAELLIDAEADRHVRWHDLRHTCATLLLQGAPLLVGEAGPWSTDDVRAMLGHSSVTVTERYTHAIGDRALAAAARTTGPRLALAPVRHGSRTGAISGAPPARFERATFGLGNRPYSSIINELAAAEGRLRASIAERDPHALHRALDLADAAEAVVGLWLAQSGEAVGS